MKSCVYCKIRYEKGSGVTFHKFPSDYTLKLWLKNMKVVNWTPTMYNYLCSKHFTDDCFITHQSRTTLKKCSVPTIFLETNSSLFQTEMSKDADQPTGYQSQKDIEMSLDKNSLLVPVQVEHIEINPEEMLPCEALAEEEPKSPVSVRVVTGLPVTPRSNGVVRPTSPLPVAPPCPPAPAPAIVALEPVPAATAPPPAPLLDFAQEHSRPRTTSNSHGPPPIPSPPSVSSNGSGSGCSNGSGSGSSGSAPRAGTREVHNKLEKNRRAHLKECFELLKRQLPATPDDKKTSNLSILGSAIRYIQVLRRKERDCEHEMERLAREKIAAQQRLSALKREISVRTTVRPRSIDAVTEEKNTEDPVNGQVLGIPISISASPPRSVARMETSPPRTLNLSTKLRTLPIQITPTTSQVVRTSYGARPSTLTLTTLAPAEPPTQNGQPVENGVTNALSTLVHPAQIHLPLSQVVGSSGLVVGSTALQLLSTTSGLRVLQTPVHTNGVTTTTVETTTTRITKENGIISPTPVSTTADGSVVVSGLTPLVVSQPATHLLQTHTLTHKMVETQMVKGTVAPLTVSAQYLSATTIVKPVVVVSAAGAAPPHAPPS